ncbi:MAG: MFS transporter [Actinobacteria bacterium]|nr:MAG: MFS transporter [Actinomycetota bacterium]
MLNPVVPSRRTLLAPASGFRLLRPLRERRFALLWSGLTISLLGDGLYTVAIAWTAYELSGVPTALTLVGLAAAIPQLVVVLFGGVLSDRFERRRVMLAADSLRALVVALIGALAVAHVLRLWELVALVGLYGIGTALFAPAITALVPELVPQEHLLEANALNQVSRPVMLRFVGPAIGGVLIAKTGVGWAFVADAASFLASLAALVAIGRHGASALTRRVRSSVLRDVGEGLAFARSQPWLLGTLVGTSVAMFFFYGPVYVLLPFVVKHVLGGSARDLGLVFAAGGIGAIVVSLTLGGRGLPRRPLTVMYLAWMVMALQLVGYATAGSIWEVVVASFGGTALLVCGQILWSTMLQRRVPLRLLGRVASLDSLLSYALVPLSYAVTAPVEAAIGVRATLIGAGLASSATLALTLAFFPRIRDVEESAEALGAQHGAAGAG